MSLPRVLAVARRTLDQNEAADSKSPSAAAGSIFLIVASTLMVCLRIWSRLTANRDRLWYDDYCAILAWPLGMFFSLIVLFQFEGLPNPGIAQAAYAVDAAYYLGMGLIRTSVLFFYARIFGIMHKFKTALWVVGVINAVYAITFVFTSSFYCIPAKKVWEPETPGHCGSIEIIYFIATLLAVIVDLVVLILPMPLLADLHASYQKKGGIALIFLLGYGVPLVSLVKLVYVGKEMTAPTEGRSAFEIPLTLTTLEIPISLISTSVPPIFSLYRHVRKFGPGSLLTSAASSEHRAELRRSSNRSGPSKKTSYDDTLSGGRPSHSLTQPSLELHPLPSASAKASAHAGSDSLRTVTPHSDD